MSFAQFSSALKLPVVNKLRAVSKTTRIGTRERATAATVPLAELIETLRPLINSGSIGIIISTVGAFRRDTPNSDQIREGFAKFVKRMQTDRAFFQKVADSIPDLLTEYGSDRIFDLPKDRRFQELLK